MPPTPALYARSLPAALALAIALFVGTASAQVPASLETWVDACDVVDGDLLALIEAEAAMVAPGFLIPNLDGTYHLARQPFAHIPASGPGARLCEDSRFFGQQRPDGFPAGRSAVLVGPDLVLTANHGFPPDVVPGHDFLFGLRYRSTPWGACLAPDFDRIPADEIYRAVEIVAHGGAAHDFALLRLDRPVAGRRPVRVRRSGVGDAGDRVTVVGHPEMLPTKVDTAGSYVGTLPSGQPLITGVHTLAGSSGSMIYNRDEQQLEGVVRTLACARYSFDGSCWKLTSSCAAGGYALGHPVRPFSPQVPAFELVVSFLDDVIYIAPEGGPLPNPETKYTLTAPDTAPGPIFYEIDPPGPVDDDVESPLPVPTREPRLELQVAGPLAGSLSPGKMLEAQTEASIVGVPCGVYERSFVVRDLTNGYADTLHHIFEIGLAEHVVEPRTGATIDGTLPHDRAVPYEVRNARPTAAVVEVVADRDWIALNGETAAAPGAAVSITLQLAPAGEPGDRVTVEVGIGGYADRLGAGVWHQGSVAFTNQTGTCADRGDTTRTVSYLPGEMK